MVSDKLHGIGDTDSVNRDTEVSRKLAADGASDAFIAVINAPTHTHADSTVSRWDSDKEWPVYGGGHWFDALWEGDVTTAWNHGDSTSRKAMEEAGLKLCATA